MRFITGKRTQELFTLRDGWREIGTIDVTTTELRSEEDIVVRIRVRVIRWQRGDRVVRIAESNETLEVSVMRLNCTITEKGSAILTPQELEPLNRGTMS